VRFKKSAFQPITKDVTLEGGKSLTADVELVSDDSAGSSGAATAGSSGITGVALNATSKAPVEDVVITLSSPGMPGGAQTAITDANGAYTFKNLPPGNYKVRFEGSAFKPLTKTITVGPKGVTANVELLPEVLFAEEVVVTGTRIPRLELDTTAPVTTVTRA